MHWVSGSFWGDALAAAITLYICATPVVLLLCALQIAAWRRQRWVNRMYGRAGHRGGRR